MATLSYGLNITKKAASSAAKPAPARRKTIFDDDSGPEDGPDDVEDNAEPISSMGSLQDSARSRQPSNKLKSNGNPPSNIAKPARISQYGDLSTNHTTSKHAQTAQSLDPSIYDYDAVYDSLHSKPKSSTNDASSTPIAAAEAKKPKYMQSLLAAAETRKRDQLRAKEKMLAKERELEGDEFADKEKFVTAAYKRQQEELRKAEAEEALRERETAERQRREGLGLKGMYKNMLQKDEEKHAEAMKSVEEAKKSGTLGKETMGKGEEMKEGKKEKSEAELAREKGAVVNEEGQVVDKRQLLNAGLNAGSAPKAKVAAPSGKDPKGSSREARRQDGPRERDTRAFEDQLLGKRGAASGEEEDDTDGRASKSRKMEDEILASLGL
ncbi:MAG: hypothetical protein LQ343_005381 [Gyalolechia ehrenbergii]|nr:MAG: hypothetical protein LQ343_005381 [Gyalolechia ehrenbergii]